MSNKSIATIATMGIDIGKNSFHVVGLDRRGAIVLRQKWSRGQIETRHANMPPCLIGMEACVGAHHPEPQTASPRSRSATDAGEICARVFQRAEKRFPRRRGDR
jgi:transposase